MPTAEELKRERRLAYNRAYNRRYRCCQGKKWNPTLEETPDWTCPLCQTTITVTSAKKHRSWCETKAERLAEQLAINQVTTPGIPVCPHETPEIPV